MIKQTYYIFFFFTVIMFMACGDDNGIDENPSETNQPTEQPSTEEKMVLGQHSAVLTEEQLDNVTSIVTGNEIIFSSTIEKTKLPKVGEILLVSDISDKFPYGFMGRVKQISEFNGNYKVKTESVALDEAFDELSINKTLVLEPEKTETRAMGWTTYIDSENFVNFEHDMNGRIDNLETSGKINIALKATCIIDINNKINKKMASIVLIARLSANPEIVLKQEGELGKIEWPYSIPIKPSLVSPAGAIASILLRPSIDIKGFVIAEGSYNFQMNGSFYKEVVAGVEYKDGQGWKAKYHSQHGTSTNEFKPTLKTEFDGTLKEGISAGLSIRLATDDLAHADITASASLVQTAKFSFNELGQTFYDVFKDTYLGTCVQIDGKIEGEIPIIGEAAEIEIPVFPTLKFFEKNYYIFPLFDNMQVVTNKEKLTAEVKSQVGRDLLFKGTEIGIQLYDKDLNLIKKTENYAYHKENEIPNPWENAFTELEKNKDYKVIPFVKLPFSEYLFKASPIKEFKIDKPEVFTLETSDKKENKLTAKGQYQLGDEIPNSYGICFSKTNKNPTVQDQKVEGNNANIDGYYSVLLENLDREKTYYYRAFIVIKDEVYYGDVKNFSIDFPIGTWCNTYVEWKERRSSEQDFTTAGEERNSIIVFMANGHIGSLNPVGEVVETVNTYTYDSNNQKMILEGWDDEEGDNPKWIKYTLDVEMTSNGFKLTNHTFNEGVETYTINTFVRVENTPNANFPNKAIRFN